MLTTMAERAFISLPLPILGLTLLAALAAAMWAGSAAARRWQARKKSQEAPFEPDQNVIGASIGLLSLLLGFTFSMAIDRFDLRRELVTEEANAISTTYLMAQTFNEADRTKLSEMLMDYVSQRIVVAQEGDPDKVRVRIAENMRLKNQFWAASLAVVAKQRDDVAAWYLQTSNTMLEIARRRESARRGFIPAPVHFVTIIFMLVVAMLVGSAQQKGTPRVSIAMLFLLTLTMTAIIDLDRPTSGRLRESQRSMELLLEDMKSNKVKDFWGPGGRAASAELDKPKA